MTSWLVTILASGPARRALRLLLAATTIALFLLNLRRSAERAGRAAERLDQLERHDAIHRQMLDAASRPRSRDDLVDYLSWGTAKPSSCASPRKWPRFPRGP
jgi:hypothetical protein